MGRWMELNAFYNGLTPSSAAPIRRTTQMAGGMRDGRSYEKLTPSF